MKCLILAAGYATRLYPLTQNFPKPLLDVKGKTIIDWILNDISKIPQLDEIIVISNHKFYDQFMDWKQSLDYKVPVTILDDGSTDNDNRLGAVRDIAYAINKLRIDDDLMVLAGDNLVDFSLVKFYNYFKEKNCTCVMRHFEPRLEKLQRTGVAVVDEHDKIMNMEEKPQNPKSNWAIPPFYIYKKSDLQHIIEGVEEERCNLDAPGSFIAWFCKNSEVYAYQMPGKRYDIGNKESYDYIKENYIGI